MLQLTKSTTFDGINGQVINFLSNDVGKLDLALCFVHDLWKGPLEAIIMFYFIYVEIGLASVIGMVFMFSFIPLQAWVGKMAATYRLKTAKRTDIRVRFMNEILQGIQVIKMYTWENSFAEMVDRIRRKEINAIRGTLYIQAALTSFCVISRFSVFLSLVAYVYFGNVITARKVFIVSSFYANLHNDFVRFWPMAITTCAEAYVSMSRITKFLLTNESRWKPPQPAKPQANNLILTGIVDEKSKHQGTETEEITELLPRRQVTNAASEPKHVCLKATGATWNREDAKSAFRMKALDLELTGQTLCSIVGPVGSGKSTLLNLVVGELAADEGSISINGTVSYAAQETWLFEASIRQNIVFVEEFDEKRYYEVIKVCALDRDIKDMPYGDLTIVGERGICLSGGQRARINLARAIYKRADIYLLDDPLSAVDTHVGKHLFDMCIRSYLSDKIVILVTHQLQVLKDVDHIVVMNAGRIEAQGSYGAIQKTPYLQSLQSETEQAEKGDQKFARLTSHSETIEEFEEPEEEREINAVGSVKFEVYKSYFKSVKSVVFLTFTFSLFLIAQMAASGLDFFVAMWVNWEESLIPIDAVPAFSSSNVTELVLDVGLNETTSTTVLVEDVLDNKTRMNYVIIYTILMGTVVWLVIHKTFSFFKLTLKASINLHDSLFRGIIKGTMWFFNNNPSGRILNRFSKDIGLIDTNLPMNIIDVIDVSI